MSKLKNLLFFTLLFFSLEYEIKSQNWTEPVNVSNMGGFNQMPDFCFDNNGVIHCVWSHIYETNFSKIFYSQSFDDGLTWTVAEDISLNSEKRIANPHLVCDSENNLHLTYDFDIGNYLETLVYYKKFDGSNWSEPIVVSENMPESHANKLVIDSNDRIYCFWYRSINNRTTFYRYLENGIWSEVFIPYDNNDYFAFLNCAVDTGNNLHWIGAHHYEGQTAYDIKPVYFIYDYENDLWIDYVEFGKNYSWYGFDIDLDAACLPHIVWQEFTNNGIPPNDGTFYEYHNGIGWTTPDLIVEDPFDQSIIIDIYNKPNILDSEKTETGTRLVHYYKTLSNWQGYVIDGDDSNGKIEMKKQDNKIYITYEKSVYNTKNFMEIMFSKMDMITIICENNEPVINLNIYPNPFCNSMTIAFEIKNNYRTQINIYSFDGKLLTNLVLFKNEWVNN